MKVKWRVDIDQYQDPMTGEIEVDDNALDEDIDSEVREDMWNTMSLTWEIVVDGSALVEREKCAKILDYRIAEITRRPAYPTKHGEEMRQAMIEALAHAAILIRARSK
jgi:hypothetical protein